MSDELKGIDLTNKHVLLKAEILRPAYRELKHRLVLCTGGFGCRPFAMGKAVFAKSPYDGAEARWDRYDFERLATDEEVAQVMEEAKNASDSKV